jgi:hypothetical protein
MEHRSYGHVDVFIFKQTLAHCGQGGTGRQRMQHHLPMTKVDALRLPGGSGRVKRCGAAVLIEVREIAPGPEAASKASYSASKKSGV